MASDPASPTDWMSRPAPFTVLHAVAPSAIVAARLARMNLRIITTSSFYCFECLVDPQNGSSAVAVPRKIVTASGLAAGTYRGNDRLAMPGMFAPNDY